MRLGNAPVSWGIFEIAGLSASTPYTRVMDEIGAAGYEGTELGPYGYYPTEPERLRAELTSRGLSLASAFVPVDLTQPAGYPAAEAETLKVASLLQALGTEEVILSEIQRPHRAAIAGRVGPADGLTEAGWESVASGLNRLGQALAQRGMRAVFHHHVATYIETGPEIDRLLDMTDPNLLGLCLDTGHAAYGGADPADLLRRWGERIRYVHLKDVHPNALARAREEGLSYEAGLRAGVFCPLGRGSVDFPAVFSELRRIGYSGWLIVEQDVIVDAAVPPSDPPLEVARQSRQFIQQIQQIRSRSSVDRIDSPFGD